ncbi:MAG: cation:proton antiporter [Candidatus Omnitrophica bacterium]|nr:cation:proton antiporter [Candidatus Omnitrophota bacterium]
MIESLAHITDKISLSHLNILLLLGLALFGGTVGGRVFQRLRIPQVVGYIIIGLAIGEAGFKIVGDSTVEALRPLNYFALGLIGFMVGGELRRDVFARYGKHFIYILLWEGIMPFAMVSLFIGFVGTLLFGNANFIWPLALLLGAIASATDPATTTAVLREYRTRGPLTTTIVGIVALDDGLALTLFALSSSVANILIGNGGSNILKTIGHPFYEIGGAVVIGALSGIVLSKLIRKYVERDRMLAFAIGMVLLVSGLSLALGVSMLLAAMTLGIIVVNFTPHKSKEVFEVVEGFTPPIYVLFFVLVGAKLKFSHMTMPIIILVVIYIIFGLSGKMLGAHIGARVSKAPRVVLKYLPFSLFSQAGVAIGLSILAAQYFPGDVGNYLLIIITATTFATQILGPPFTKLAVSKAGEIDLNITEEDIINKSRVEEIMDKNPPVINENMQLKEILTIFSENDNLYYPVVNKNKELTGIITIDGIKQTVLETDIGGLILAHDVMQPVIASIDTSAPAQKVHELLDRYNIDYLPVVSNDNRLQGFIEKKVFNKLISTKVIELQKRVEDDSI